MPSKKIWLKKIFSKFFPKPTRFCRPICVGLLTFRDQLPDRSLLLKLSGDLESNPRPKSATRGKEKDESSLAMILESSADLKSDQAWMKDNQN